MHEITYLLTDELVTTHPVLPALSTVFNFDLGKLSNCLIPFLTVDLKQINPAWRHQYVHFIYYEHPEIDEFIFELDHRHYKSIKAVHHHFHQPIPVNPQEEEQSFANLSQFKKAQTKQLYATFRTYSAGKNITKIYQPAVDLNFAKGSVNAYQSIIDNMDIISTKECYFNPYPVPIQEDFIFPSDPDGGQMQFIGQVNSLTFGLPACQYYLFYCPKYHLVKQIIQFDKTNK